MKSSGRSDGARAAIRIGGYCVLKKQIVSARKRAAGSLGTVGAAVVVVVVVLLEEGRARKGFEGCG
jgi:uncharacterized membrane protein